MQTILGAGGAIGTELAKSLKTYTSDIRLVSRKPQKVNDTDQLLAADLTNKEQVLKAVEGSTICYLTIGLKYDTKLWQQLWPPMIKNVVEACRQHKAKLVFFDNVYAIGADHMKNINEDSPISPCSKKGVVRAEVDKYLIEQTEKGNIEAIIARSPDFFSAMPDNSLLMNLIYNNLAKGKSSQWFCNADVIHTTGYAPELAKGTAMLGNSDGTFNQIWNLPVDQQNITGRQWAKLFADAMNGSDKVKVLPAWGMKMIGWFVPVIKEMHEMRYQYDRNYYFDCTKFLNRFEYTPISNKAAVQETIDLMNTKA